MNFFEYIISPFIWFIEQVFLFSYNITGNYGLAIILLSFSVSLLLLPVFIYIEKSKKKDDVIKKKMQPLIDEIKRVYKGQERYYYLKTINRQHNYSSLKALIPILSLLIQIPFFIAAYQYLEHFEGLKGVSFLFIQDLGAPDGLFGVVNILPILMTIINLITVYYYTRLGDGSERKQMLVIAIAFLVLLFNLPAGLVMYWTMNNLFSFFRLFITNPEVFKKQEGDYGFSEFKSDFKALLPRLKTIFIVVFVLLVLSQLAWAIKYYFDDFAFRLFAATIVSIALTLLIAVGIILYQRNKDRILNLEVKPMVFFSLLFLSVYFYLASKFYFTGENESLALFSVLALFLIQPIILIYSLRSKDIFRFSKYLRWVIHSISIYQLLIFLSILLGKDFSISLFDVSLKFDSHSWYNFIEPGILSVFLFLPFYTSTINFKPLVVRKNMTLMYVLSVVFIFGLIFFWKPLLVYASSPDTFDFPAILIFRNNAFLFFSNVLLAIGLFFILPKKLRIYLFYFSLVFVVISFIYSLVIPINLGSLQVSQFSEQNNLAAPISDFLLESILLIFIFLAIKWLFKKQYFKVTTYVLIAFNLLLISQSLYSSISTGFFFSTLEDKNDKETIGIPFSKTKKNIVYFLADGFQGWFLNQILKEDPKLLDDFSGFTYFPNTVSVSNYTHSSLPALFLGLDYAPLQLNKDEQHSNEEKVNSASQKFMKACRDRGYTYSSTLMHYSRLTPNDFDNYIPMWTNKWDKLATKIALGTEVDAWRKRLYENALFYSLPLFLKPKIYNNTEWLAYYKIKKIKKDKKHKARYSHKHYNFIRLLPYISTATSKDANFIYIHDHSLHNPWNTVDETGEMHQDVKPYENNRWFIREFVKWIQWMKDNGVYNNTKIIVYSDHGVSWGILDRQPDVKSNIDFTKNNPSGINAKKFWRLNPLLFYKDFNSTGKLTYNWQLMSNADASFLAFNENLDTLPKHKVLPSSFTSWEGKVLQRNRLKIYRQYEVTDNIFDLRNWKSNIIDNIESVIIEDNTEIQTLKQKQSKIIRTIKNNPKWFLKVKEQAEFNHLSLDSMLIISANYVIKHTKPKLSKRDRKIQEIKNNSKWLAKVEKQAKERGISIDSMLIRTADYVLKVQAEKNKKNGTN